MVGELFALPHIHKVLRSSGFALGPSLLAQRFLETGVAICQHASRCAFTPGLLRCGGPFAQALARLEPLHFYAGRQGFVDSRVVVLLWTLKLSNGQGHAHLIVGCDMVSDRAQRETIYVYFGFDIICVLALERARPFPAPLRGESSPMRV